MSRNKNLFINSIKYILKIFKVLLLLMVINNNRIIIINNNRMVIIKKCRMN